jgi:hypothetical protein
MRRRGAICAALLGLPVPSRFVFFGQRFEQNKTLLRLAGFQRLAFSPGGCLSGLARTRPDSQLAFV